MKSIMKLAVVVALVAFGASVVRADAPMLSGYLETGYNYNFNNPTTQTNRDQAFSNKADTFNLNAFQLQATGKVGDSSGYTAKALFGQDATVLNAANGNGAGNVAIEEAYAWYKAPLGKGLTITAGKFVTF